jgi:hypothetical protein
MSVRLMHVKLAKRAGEALGVSAACVWTRRRPEQLVLVVVVRQAETAE